MIKGILSAILISLTIGICSIAQAQTTVPEVTYEWTAPTTGAPVVVYKVELKVNDGEWVYVGETPNLQYTFINQFEYLSTYQVRVAGVDIYSRWGVYSEPSDPYTPDLGIPSAPGKPVILQF